MLNIGTLYDMVPRTDTGDGGLLGFAPANDFNFCALVGDTTLDLNTVRLCHWRWAATYTSCDNSSTA